MSRSAVIRVGILCFALFAGLVGFSFYTLHFTSDIGKHVHSLVVNLAFAFLSIAGTVLVVDRLNEARVAREDRRRLLREMSSIDNSIALRGARELKDLGLTDTGFFDGADLSGADLSRAKLESLKGERIKLVGTVLNEADLSRSNLIGVVANFARFESANLEGCIFEGGSAIGATFDGADLNRANLSNCILKAATFRNADMRGADLRGAVLVDAVLDDVRVEGCQLEGATISPDAIETFEGWTVVELGSKEFTLTKKPQETI